MATDKGKHWKKWSLARRATACAMAATLAFTLAWPGVNPFEGEAYTGSGGTNVSSSNHTIVSSSEDFVDDGLALKLNYSKFTGVDNIVNSSTNTQSKVKKRDMASDDLLVLYVDNSDNFTKGSSTSSGKNNTSTWSSLGAKVYFEDVCTIGGVKVDATVTIQRVKIGKHLQYSTGSASTSSFTKHETQDGSKVGIAYVTSGGLWVGASSSAVSGYCWTAQRDIKVKVTLTWDSDLTSSVDLGDTTARAGSTVDLDFYTYITDIDINNSCTEESWSYDSGDGFRTAKAYRTAYSNNVLKQSTSTSGGVTTRKYWHWRSSDIVEDDWGNDVMKEYYSTGGTNTTERCCGVYTQTNGGEFTSTFGVSQCAMKLTAYSQYDAVESPSKFIYKNSDFKLSSKEYAGDTITWYVTWKMGKAYDDTTQPYSKLRIVDDLPTGKVTFNKAVMYRGKRANIAAGSSSNYTKLATITSSDTSDYSNHPNHGSGTLEYDSGAVRFIFDGDWLDGSDDGASDGSDWADNYWGQYYTMVITVTIKDSVSANATIVNSATTKVDGVPYDSNEVTTTVKQPVTPVLSLTKTTYDSSGSTALAKSTLTSEVSATLSGYRSGQLYDSTVPAYLVWTKLSGTATSGAWIQWDLNESLTFYFQLPADADADDYICAMVKSAGGTPTSVTSTTYVSVCILGYAPADGFTTASGWSSRTSVTALQESSPAAGLTTTSGATSAKWNAYNNTTSWRIVVTASEADAENVKVTDNVPSYLSLSDVSVTSTSKAEGEKVASFTTGAGGSFTVTADSLDEDGSIVIWLKTTLASSSYVRRNITNTAYATCDDWDGTASASDTVAYYASGGTYTVTEVPDPELSITKEADVQRRTHRTAADYDDNDTFLLYDDFTISYVQLSEALAADKSVTMRINSFGSVSFAFDEEIPAGSYLFYSTESTDYGKTVYAVSSLSSKLELAELVDTAFASAETTYVSMTATIGKFVRVGDVVKWTVTVENTGEASSVASDTVVTDSVPEGLTLLTSSGYYPTAKKGSTLLSVSVTDDTWTTASTSLSYGDVITVTFYTTVEEGYEWQKLVNTATASSSDASSVSATDSVIPYDFDGPTKYQKTVGWDESASELDWTCANIDEGSAQEARYDDTIYYRIEQGMPMLEYGTIAFEDTLPAELEYVSMSVYVDDEDVTSQWSVTAGDWSSSGTALSATCSSPESSWFSESVLLAFEIECSIAEEAEVGYFHNTATVAFDSTSNATNEVWTNLWLSTQDPTISITKTAEVTPSPEGVYSESDYVTLSGYDGTSSSSGETVLYLYLALSEDLAEGSWVCWQPGWSSTAADDSEDADEDGESEDEAAAVTFESASGTYWFQVPADLAAGQFLALGFDEEGTLTFEVTAFAVLPGGSTGTALGTAEVISADYKYVKAGTSFWWSVTVEEGNEYATAEHVVVSDAIPEELEYVSGTLSTTLGTASFDEDTNTWTVDLGEPGQLGEYAGDYSFEVRFQTTAPEAHDDAIVNTASVTADGDLSAEASDEVVVYAASEQLPTTGAPAMRSLGATAALAAFAGVCVAVHARRRRKQREELVRNFHRV